MKDSFHTLLCPVLEQAPSQYVYKFRYLKNINILFYSSDNKGDNFTNFNIPQLYFLLTIFFMLYQNFVVQFFFLWHILKYQRLRDCTSTYLTKLGNSRFATVTLNTVELGYNEIVGTEQKSSLQPRSRYSRGPDFFSEITSCLSYLTCSCVQFTLFQLLTCFLLTVC